MAPDPDRTAMAPEPDKTAMAPDPDRTAMAPDPDRTAMAPEPASAEATRLVPETLESTYDRLIAAGIAADQPA